MKIIVADPSDSDRIREIYLKAFDDPGYYQRFGFTRKLAENFVPPYPPRYPLGWQALRLDAREFPDEPVSIECVGALCSPEIW